MIVGVCDNDCADVDLALEDKNGVALAGETAGDYLPNIDFTPSTTATYWVESTMYDCRIEPCRYGIGVFVQ